MKNYYYDNTHPLRPFTFEADANENSQPPSNALRVKPEIKEGFIPCELNGAWIQVQDSRGKKAYSKSDPLVSIEVTELGAIYEAYTLIAPPVSYVDWDEANSNWKKSLTKKKKELSDEVNEQYQYHYNNAYDYKGSIVGIGDRSIIREEIADAQDLGEEEITLKFGGEWSKLSLADAQAIIDALVVRLKHLTQARKAHDNAITEIKSLKLAEEYDVTTGW